MHAIRSDGMFFVRSVSDYLSGGSHPSYTRVVKVLPFFFEAIRSKINKNKIMSIVEAAIPSNRSVTEGGGRSNLISDDHAIRISSGKEAPGKPYASSLHLLIFIRPVE